MILVTAFQSVYAPVVGGRTPLRPCEWGFCATTEALDRDVWIAGYLDDLRDAGFKVWEHRTGMWEAEREFLAFGRVDGRPQPMSIQHHIVVWTHMQQTRTAGGKPLLPTVPIHGGREVPLPWWRLRRSS